MLYKGVFYRRDKNLQFRNGNDKDVSAEGGKVESNYVVIVKLQDCELDAHPTKTVNGRPRLYANPTKAPQAYKLFYTRTNAGFTKYVERTAKETKVLESGNGKEIIVHAGQKYWKNMCFAVIDGYVYRATGYKAEKPSPRYL